MNVVVSVVHLCNKILLERGGERDEERKGREIKEKQKREKVRQRKATSDCLTPVSTCTSMKDSESGERKRQRVRCLESKNGDIKTNRTLIRCGRKKAPSCAES